VVYQAWLLRTDCLKNLKVGLLCPTGENCIDYQQETVLVVEYGNLDNSTQTLWPYYGTVYNDPDMFRLLYVAVQRNLDGFSCFPESLNSTTRLLSTVASQRRPYISQFKGGVL
jgi:hypothetical protein